MSQNIFSNINPSATSGNDLATLLNDFKDAIASGFSGTARPANLQAGGYWIDTTLAPTPDFLWKYMMWTGTTDILVFSVNINTNTIIFSGTSGTYTVSQTSADAVGPIIAMLKKRIATNGQTIVGDVLGEIQFKSTDDLGAAMISARIKAVSNNSTTSSQAGAYLVFEEINTNSGSISEKMRLLDGKLGVGTTAPATAIHITSLTGFTNERIDDSANGPTSIMKKSRVAGSGQVLSGDSLGKYNFKSTDETGAEIDSAVVIESFATQNHSSTAQGSKVTVGVKKTGATTVTEKMSIGDVLNFPEGHQTKNEVIGTSGTAATNVKLHRSATGKLQVVLGNDATSEGSAATVLAEIGSKTETFTNAGKPAAGNIGRVIYVSDTEKYEYDNGTVWQVVNSTFDKLTSVEQVSAPATPAAGKRVLYSKADGFYSLDSAGNSVKVGSGAGGGTVNLIADGNADDRASSIFTLYADAAASRPVDGTGGSPNITTSITSTNPLTGTKSYLITKDAANRQGQGGAITFTVDPSYRAKVLKISIDYIVNSGTFAAGSSTTDSDLIWYLYDVTNNTLIEPSSIKMFASSTTISDKFEATFQTSATGSSYRLIAHVATTSASAWELKLDNITISPSVYVYGTPITDWVSWTPTGSWTTNTTYTGKKRRVGDEYEYFVKVSTSGAPNVAALTINLQETIDTTKLNSTIQYATAFESAGNAYDSGNGYPVKVAYTTTTSVVLLTNGSPEAVVGPTAPFTFGAGDEVNVRFTLPILGLSSSVQMSDSAETRLVAVQLGGAAVATTAQTPIIFPTAANDTHGSYNATTGRYLVQSAGYYRVTLYSVGGTIAAGQFAYASVNAAAPAGTNSPRLGNTVNANDPLIGTGVVFAKSGDFIDIRPSVNYGALNAVSTASITKIQGPQAIAANESINCRYSTAAGQTINGTAPIIIFGTKSYDSHGFYNPATGVFTANVGGKYAVKAKITTAVATYATSTEVECLLYKNGTQYSELGRKFGNGTSIALDAGGSDTVDLLAGGTIDVRGYANVSTTLLASGLTNYITIEKVG